MSDLFSRDGSLVLAPGNRSLLLSGAGSCCCGECQYYKATLCNLQVCSLGFPDIFICVGTRCQVTAELIVPGSVIKYGNRCYLVGATIYCPQSSDFLTRVLDFIRGIFRSGTPGSQDPGSIPPPGGNPGPCMPLPPNPVIAGAPDSCVPACNNQIDCPPVDGWYPATPCPCPGMGNAPCVVVSCSAYIASLGPSICPTWNIAGRCYYVAPGAQPTTEPGECFQVTSLATHENCCQCCGTSGIGCCYSQTPNTHQSWLNGQSTTTVGTPTYCCWLQSAYEATGSAIRFSTWNFPHGGMENCPNQLIERTMSGGFVYSTITDWVIEAGDPPCGHTVVTTDIPRPVGVCSDGAAMLSSIAADLVPFQPSGTVDYNCGSGSMNFTGNGGPGSTSTTLTASVSASGGSGCGSPGNCGPGGVSLSPDKSGLTALDFL